MCKVLLTVFVLSSTLLAACAAERAASRAEVGEQRPPAYAKPTLPDESLMVGMLRSNGALVPFAEYSRGMWSNPWKKGETFTEDDPHILTDMPQPWFTQSRNPSDTWHFYSWSGDAQVIRTSETVEVVNHSGTNWGLGTSYPDESAGETHHRNLGVAFESEQEIAGMVNLKADSLGQNELHAFIKTNFEKIEDGKFANPALQSRDAAPEHFPQSAAKRRAVKLDLKHLYRNKAGLGGQFVYHFEAQKNYDNPPSSSHQRYPNVSLFQGWIMKTKAGNLTLLKSAHAFTDCDRKGTSYTKAFLMVKVEGRTFIVSQSHGWEDESYSIWEIKDSSIRRVLETLGG